MTILQPGANVAIPLADLEVLVKFDPPAVPNTDVDVSAFQLTTANKVRSDADMVFYGQRSNGNGSLSMQDSAQAQAAFTLKLSQMEAAVEKIALTATIYENRQTFSVFKSVTLLLRHQGETVAEALIQTQGMVETALILGEFYRRQGAWKFRSVGQGFAGGLKPLAEHFGVSIADKPATPPPAPAPVASNPPPVTPAPAKVSLSKVSLDKSRPTVSLEKKGGSYGEIKVNLNWNRNGQQPQSKGFFAGLMGKSGKIDLDIGCFVELADGRKTVVQALGNSFGNFLAAPYVELLGDDRTGAVSDGEWIRINGQHWHEIRRLQVFAFIYEGAPNWAATDGVVTVHAPGQPPVEVCLTEGSNKLGMCAVATLENRGGQLSITRDVRYFAGHRDVDAAFGWGLRWSAGSKD